GENREGDWKPILTENLDCPAHRASQPDGMSGRPAADSREMRPPMTELTGGISPARPLAVRLRICETGTEEGYQRRESLTSIGGERDLSQSLRSLRSDLSVGVTQGPDHRLRDPRVLPGSFAELRDHSGSCRGTPPAQKT